MSGHSNGAAPDATRRARDEWVVRVLSVRVSSARPAVQAASLAVAPRPAGSPANALTTALVSAAKSTSLPADDAELPDLLTGFAPQFIAAVLDEPEMSTGDLAPGVSIAPQDQMLGVADLLDTAGRKLQRWSGLLDEAEAAKRRLVSPESEEGESDANSEVVAGYNTKRAEGLDMQAEIAAMLTEIRGACKGLAGSSGAET